VEAKKVKVVEKVSASKKLQRSDARTIAKEASQIIVMKGKKIQEFKGGGSPSKELLDAMLGATGNLRAPLMRIGKKVLVGFNDEIYGKTF